MNSIKIWFTNPTFHSIYQRVLLTLDYLEEVSERPEVEQSLTKDLEQMKKWIYGSLERQTVVSECLIRYESIQQKRQP